MGGAWCSTIGGNMGCDDGGCTWGGEVVCWCYLFMLSNYNVEPMFVVCHPPLTLILS